MDFSCNPLLEKEKLYNLKLSVEETYECLVNYII
jgi:hypothetical protein